MSIILRFIRPLRILSDLAGSVGRRPGGALSLLAIVLAAASAPVGAGGDDRGWLGVYTDPVDTLPEIQAATGGPATLRGASSGLRVSVVFPDSPAEIGGLLEGDIIIAIADRALDCSPDSARRLFKREIDARTAGTPCPLRVLRDAAWRDLRIGDAQAPPHLATLFWRSPQAVIDSLAHGGVATAEIRKQQQVLDLPIVLVV